MIHLNPLESWLLIGAVVATLIAIYEFSTYKKGAK